METDNQNQTNRRFIPAAEKADIYADGRKYRTCAYCRVSTDSEEQMSSFELQNEHYRNLAGKHPNWNLTRIYADEGISGTSLKNRDQFNSMLKACENGEYDLIVTKSVSRFARNLVDCISIVRRLKHLPSPVGVFFETDNLFTLSEDSELKLSLLATFAQEESVKKSESMIWSLKERFKNQRLLMPEPYGYSRQRMPSGKYDLNARLEIVEDEAVVVRFIYDAFLSGYTFQSICGILQELGIPSKTGKDRWNEASVRYILSNERYCGNVLTWKTFTADIFEHRKKRNIQDRDQYIYERMHEPIVSVEKFEAAQTLLENIRQGARTISPVNVIDVGIFKGYVPVNHHWINDDPKVYFEASNSMDDEQGKTFPVKKSSLSHFDLGGFQVVRGSILTYRAERPSVTISENRLSFNRECIRRFSDVKYVQLLIHPSERRIAIRPCSASDIYSIRWSTKSENLNYGKIINTPYFSSALYRIMNWNPDFQYISRGTFLSQGNEKIIVFDVSGAISAAYVQCEEDGKRRRVLVCPDEWNGSFGEEFYDFILQNDLYYIRTSGIWGSQSKAVPFGKSGVSVPTENDIRVSMDILKLRSVSNG